MAELIDVYFIIVRWTHVVAGIIWIGLLYYFNFVQIPSFKQLQPATRSALVPTLVKRALFWFRWAAVVTVLAGWLYAISWGAAGRAYPSWAISIMTGGALGTMMLFNVWGIIWVHQKKVIAATEAQATGTPPPAEMPIWAKRATIASRWNTAMSLPMLFFMVAASHLNLV